MDFLSLGAPLMAAVTGAGCGLHFLNYRETKRNQRAIRQMPDGLGEEVATMMVRIEAVRFVNAVLLLATAVAVAADTSLWSPALLPVAPIIFIMVWASWRDLSSRERQAAMATAVLAERAATQIRDLAANTARAVTDLAEVTASRLEAQTQSATPPPPALPPSE